MAKKKATKRKKPKPVCNVIKDLQRLLVPIGTLREDPANARVHDARNIKAIEASFDKFGQRKPVVVNKRNRIIEAGNGSVQAAKRLKWTHIAAVFVEDDPEDEMGYKLADNRTAELAAWDKERLQESLAFLHEMEFDIAVTGFSVQDIKGLGIGGDGGGGEVDAEIEFTEELLLEHNYVVLYFDNPLDWEVAKEKFGLKIVKDLIPRKGQPKGIGRVIDGAAILEKIK